jgi:hypothetical protein
MCMADIRISRFVTTTFRVLADNGADVLLAAANKQRVGIEIFPLFRDAPGIPTTISGYVAIGEAVVLQFGIPCYFGMPTLKWTFANDGNTPQLMFRGGTNNGNLDGWVVVERWLPESILDSHLVEL